MAGQFFLGYIGGLWIFSNKRPKFKNQCKIRGTRVVITFQKGHSYVKRKTTQ